MRALWKNVVLADSDATVVVEGNHYFPPGTLNPAYFKESDTHTTCPWKGEASYYNIEVDGEVKKDAAWTYPEPKEKAQHIKDYVAFGEGIEVVE
ncbi:MAG: DUF427 domain-containing protein [Thermodesulfobacteriota bacterium]